MLPLACCFGPERTIWCSGVIIKVQELHWDCSWDLNLQPFKIFWVCTSCTWHSNLRPLGQARIPVSRPIDACELTLRRKMLEGPVLDMCSFWSPIQQASIRSQSNPLKLSVWAFEDAIQEHLLLEHKSKMSQICANYGINIHQLPPQCNQGHRLSDHKLQFKLRGFLTSLCCTATPSTVSLLGQTLRIDVHCVKLEQTYRKPCVIACHSYQCYQWHWCNMWFTSLGIVGCVHQLLNLRMTLIWSFVGQCKVKVGFVRTLPAAITTICDMNFPHEKYLHSTSMGNFSLIF